jgi:hypothetical protein
LKLPSAAFNALQACRGKAALATEATTLNRATARLTLTLLIIGLCQVH